MYKGQKGITLVALVITVIVLLILAGVALSMISSGDTNSLFSKSKKAANEYSNKAQEENEVVGDLINVLNNEIPDDGE